MNVPVLTDVTCSYSLQAPWSIAPTRSEGMARRGFQELEAALCEYVRRAESCVPKSGEVKRQKARLFEGESEHIKDARLQQSSAT